MISRILLFLAIAAVLGAAALGGWLSQSLEPLADEAEPVLFTVEPGESLRGIATRLQREGLVRDVEATVLLARYRELGQKLSAGEFFLSADQSPSEILDVLVKGRPATYPVSIPEGLTAIEIGRIIADAGLVDREEFAAAFASADLLERWEIPAENLEGYLFPETYRFPKGLSGEQVVEVMLEQFEQAWKRVADRAGERGLSRHEVVILASIVEKETGAAEERPLIASVFANRIERNMRLESDPTIIYGIPNFDGNLRRRHLDDASNLYNTYQHAGLTPGPIANPGLESLEAVVAPAESDYLFFVSRNDGTHVFSKNYRDHVRAVDRYQRRRGGS